MTQHSAVLRAGVLVCATAACAATTDLAAQAPPDTRPIDAVVIHPPVAAEFTCREHALGSEDHAGDALGADCRVYRSDGGPFGNFPRFHTGDGTRKDARFRRKEPSLAPFDGGVRLIPANPLPDPPGSR